MREAATRSAKVARKEGNVVPLRRLSLPTRLREGLRHSTDRVLASDGFWSALFVVVVTALLLTSPRGVGRSRFAVGEIAPFDIVARSEVEVVDPVLTEERRKAARDAVPDVFVFDAERGERVARQISRLFDSGRAALEETAGSSAEASANAVRKALKGFVGEDDIEALLRCGFSVEIERELVGELERVMRNPIASNKALLERQKAILLARGAGEREKRLPDDASVLDLEEARHLVHDSITRSVALPEEVRERLASLVSSFVDVSLAFDAEQTERKRQAAAEATPPAVARLAPGTVLVRAGDRFTAESLARVEAARGAASRRANLVVFAGLVILVLLFAFFLYRYAAYHQRRFRKVKHLHAMIVLVLVSMLLLARGILWVAAEVTDDLSAPFNSLSSYTYLIPLGAGSILITLLANGRIAMVYSGLTALLFGAETGWDAFGMTWALVVQWAGVYAITAYRERAALLRAGLVVGGAGAAAELSVEALKSGAEPLGANLFGAGLAFVGGAVGAGLLVSFALPLLERLFNVLTDIRLLELSNVNNPLLSQLAVKAPGSYNHSLVVGNLAEEAAKAIGANSLFCRVAAFYHDLGKLQKPEYYVENQSGVNPHDRLSPSMSVLIITSHVKDGVRLAREAGLPEQIVDIIPQHHGTRVMTYFYEKARRKADPALGGVSEADFRYPGPKPQSREAAIFMLADAVEAAARTVDEPTPGRLREVIHKVSTAIVVDGQLDECDLTFADLERTEETFLRALVSMYHHRVDYPGFWFGRARTEPKPASEGAERRAARESRNGRSRP